MSTSHALLQVAEHAFAAPAGQHLLAAWAYAAGLCVLAPLVGERWMPLSSRLCIATVLAGGLSVAAEPAAPLPGPAALNVLALPALGGLLLGLALRMTWTLIAAGGHLLSLASGLGLSDALAPGDGAATSPTDAPAGPAGALAYLVGLGAFLACGADLVLWQVVLAGPPAASSADLPALATALTGLLGRAALAGILLAVPALVAWAMIEGTLAVVGRAYPLPAGWVVVLPLRAGAGLVLLAACTAVMWRLASPLWLGLLAPLRGGLTP